MGPPTTTIERAFDLARSGTCRDVEDIRRKLKADGYSGVEEHLRSTSLAKQLRALVKASSSAP